MTPAEVAKQLLANKKELSDLIQEVRPYLSLKVVHQLVNHVMTESYRNPNEALKVAELSQQVANKVGTDEAYALVAWGKGVALSYLNRYEESLQYQVQAEQFYAKQGNDKYVAGLQINRLSIYYEIGNFPKALELANQAKAVCERIGEPAREYLANLEINVGNIYQAMGQLTKALQTYEIARARYHALDKPLFVAQADINRALLLAKMDQFDAAEKLFTEARLILVECESDQEVARADLNLGILAYRRGQYQRALQYLEISHDGFAALPNWTEVAVVNLYRSFVYLELNLFPEAMDIAATAVPTFAKSKLYLQQALAIINQGKALFHQKEFELAEELLSRARRLLMRIKAHQPLPNLDIMRAELALTTNRTARAKRIANRLLKTIDPKIQPRQACHLNLLLARCVFKMPAPNLGMIRKYLTNAQEIINQYELTELSVQTSFLSGQLEVASGQSLAGLHSYQETLQTIEYWRKHLVSDELQLNFMADKASFYKETVRLTHSLVQETAVSPEQLAYSLNLAISVPVVQLQPSIAPKTTGGKKLQQELETLRQRRRWLQSKLDQPNDLHEAQDEAAVSAESIAELYQQLHDTESQIIELVRRQQVRQQHNLQTEQPASAPTSAEQWTTAVQESIQQDELLLHYYLSDDALHAVAMAHDQINQFANLATVADVEQGLNAWRFHISSPTSVLSPAGKMIAQKSLYHLYNALLKPLGAVIEGKSRLLIILPQQWHDLPMAACFDGQLYLAETHQLVYLSAADSLLTRQQSQPSTSDSKEKVLILGHTDNGRLPFTKQEATTISEALKPHYHVTQLIDEDASFARFLEASNGCKLIHLATHALFRPDNPLFSWVRLADRDLTVADIYDMTFAERPFVVLSACETGRGQSRGGGLVGMGRSLLAAGASGLMVSQWRIEDTSSEQFIANFYQQYIKGGKAISKALRHAQMQAIQRRLHPFYWASYIFVGG